jgi:hypothetical protein
MTPKEKAKELVDKFIEPTRVPIIKFIGVEYIDSSKQCALIAVDEILNNNKILFEDVLNDQYWQEVKQEIEKL